MFVEENFVLAYIQVRNRETLQKINHNLCKKWYKGEFKKENKTNMFVY